jgi:hypothetical protein
MTLRLPAMAAICFLTAARLAMAQGAAGGTTYDEGLTPGANFDKAEFSIAGGPGFAGDLATHTYRPASSPGTPSAPNAWLVSERLAKAWQAAMIPK